MGPNWLSALLAQRAVRGIVLAAGGPTAIVVVPLEGGCPQPPRVRLRSINRDRDPRWLSALLAQHAGRGIVLAAGCPTGIVTASLELSLIHI